MPEAREAPEEFAQPEAPVERAEPVEPGGPAEPVEPEPLPERYARLGVQGLARLRTRYADLKGRLADKPVEGAERDELMAKAERLNPDAWATADEVAAGLEDYESVFESLRGIVGRQPRQRRL